MLGNTFQGGDSLLPVLASTDRLLRSRRDVPLEVLQAKCPQNVEGKLQGMLNLIFDLVGSAKCVSIILGEATHTGQAMQYATALKAVDAAIFGVAFGHFLI